MRLKPQAPLLYILNNCKNLIEALPALPIDLKHPEDCDTTARDHEADALRYLCMARLVENDFKTAEVPAIMGGVANISRYVQRKKAERRTRL